MLAPTVNFLNSDLTPFRRQGGKLLLYHGWADFIVSPQDTINYVDRIAAENRMLALGRQQFVRLFMVPGMGHCSGGSGPNAFDALTPLVAWVEQGMPPASIVATKYVNNQPAQGIERTRPLCPYPYEARYDGSGDPTQASSFACAGPSRPLPPAELPAPAYLAPLVIEATASPRLLNLQQRGSFTITLTTAPGSQTFNDWVPSSIKVEGKAPTAVSFSPDGRTVTATFARADLAGFTGGAPAGKAVELMVTGALQHAGTRSLFAVGATVQVVQR